MSQLKKIEEALVKAPSIKALTQLSFVQERFIANYSAVTGKKDGEARFQSEMFAFLEILHDKPDLAKADRFSIFAGIVKAGTMGLSFRDNKLYVMPGKNNTIQVKSSPAGKREQMEMMPEILQVPEAQVVMKGDKFTHDKLNGRVTAHETTEKSETKIHLDNIIAAYQTIEWKDGRRKEVVVYRDDLLKAKAKSPAQSEAAFWNQYPGEAAKKVATNRTFRLFHKYPDNIITYNKDVDKDDDETTDIDYSNVDPIESEQTDTSKKTPEKLPEAKPEPVEEVKEPVKKQQPVKQEKQKEDLDNYLNGN